MKASPLHISSLPAWSKLNGITWHDVDVRPCAAAGYGVVAERALPSSAAATATAATEHTLPLLRVPAQLVLGKEAVEEFAKADGALRELLEATRGKSIRGDVILFLVMQITMAAGHDVGVRNPWTEYVRMLPETVPLPTMWTAEQQEFLIGTSLESALEAKSIALSREFDQLRGRTESVSWCAKTWWATDSLTLADWILADAWYRSRSLELPQSGEAMVPCLDMANHSAAATAYYEQSETSGDVLLLLRPEQTLKAGDEITISYGSDKSDAEMLFSYGFIPSRTSSSLSSLTLPLPPPPDDPLGPAKLACFPQAPALHISEQRLSSSSCPSPIPPPEISISAPFMYLLALNEEDGLDFKTLQQTDGAHGALRTFWQGVDVSHATDRFEDLIAQHQLRDVFALRVVALLQARVRDQLDRLQRSAGLLEAYGTADGIALAADADANDNDAGDDGRVYAAAMALRESEQALLERAYEVLEEQNAFLMTSPVVLEYLAAMTEVEPGSYDDEDEPADDFS